MAHLYKEPRFCGCGYSTSNRSRFSSHKRSCPHSKADTPNVETELRERVASLEAQLATKDEQLATRDEQLATKEERIAALEQMLGQHLKEVKKELRETKKRKDHYAEKTTKRLKLPEPRRRVIAMRQEFMCANPDGGCLLAGVLEEYDIDHIVPLWKGGEDAPQNMQALCPACHRRKSDRERLERSEGISTTGPEV